jgi:hypothetical protein
MSIVEQAEIQSKIAQIIERSRHHEEQLLVDSKTAALNIMRFLKNKNLLEIFYEETDY